ncbi:hypothetical protein [Thalassoglobus polymorphus]|uniref:Uncharacterized protein n=1 Tax=Thalassoglobus polymorphus TaxID=2527994 RepID=A0A517QTK6_9PLAN|nr:hypothetical protein [Thalassoglobus polymorphus]QDT34976.1 hypothetical protein Mal48_42490 [Thalassoglobus polymorphus]
MKLDLSKDKEKIRKYILNRIKDYSVYVNDGPGEDDAPIQAIMLGFYAEQGGYIYLVFDTRPGKNLDGNWTLHIDEPNMLHFPRWCDFYEKACDGKTVTLILDDGTVKKLDGTVNKLALRSGDEDALDVYFAEMLKALMCELKEDGTLAKLPLRKDAYFMIEEFDGRYFWPEIRSVRSKGRILK